ncbi:MAG TPA: hypothetical protein VFA19_13840 [Gaiellaceae bacterium]|nr:hypothetical protein [Gaiellaceae bacterium]
MVRGLAAISALFGACALLASGCGETKPAAAAAPPAPAAPACAHPAGWQRLANRIKAPVYCPGWLPDPLVGRLGGQWNNINAVSPDRSYLESFVWQDVDLGGTSGELHVNLRGYPGRHTIPTCRTGGAESRNVPCFADPHGTVTERGITATIYTVNQDADTWHVALVWRAHGGLYTLSEHVAPPVDSTDKVVAYLRHELRRLVLIEPKG